MKYIAILVILSLICFAFLGLLNKHLPVWFCDNMGWHLEPKKQGFDGCSFTGKCPRCGKNVLQDGQGNWF